MTKKKAKVVYVLRFSGAFGDYNELCIYCNITITPLVCVKWFGIDENRCLIQTTENLLRSTSLDLLRKMTSYDTDLDVLLLYQS